MGVDVHDAGEGDVVIFESSQMNAELTLGVVVASTGCTIWAQPLRRARDAANIAADSELVLLEDTSSEPVQLQGEVAHVLAADTFAFDASGPWSVRRADVPGAIARALFGT
jgi:hypothetical protein